MKNELIQKCKKIKVVITDVDGVLTDGGMYYTKDGDIMKKFHARDGMGVTLLRKTGIPTIIVTKEETEIVKKWAERMKVEKLYKGIVQKEILITTICNEYHITNEEISYIGDDINDVELLKKVGLSAVPNDGVIEAKNICDYVCKSNGGEGAFRELVDMILSNYR